MTYHRTRDWKHAWMRCDTTGEQAPRFRCRCGACGAARGAIAREIAKKKRVAAERRALLHPGNPHER